MRNYWLDRKEQDSKLNDLDPTKVDECLSWVRTFLEEKETIEYEGAEPDCMANVLKRLIQNDPEKWWVGHHFGWGMWMRNELRTAGFGEAELQIENLDDYYIPLVTTALK